MARYGMNKSWPRLLTWLFPLWALLPAYAMAADKKLTLYQSGMALVQDTRELNWAAGQSRYEWQGVASSLQPESVFLNDQAQAAVRAFVYQNARVASRQALLERAVGKKIGVTYPGEPAWHFGTLLSADGGGIVRLKNGVETGPFARIQFPANISLPHQAPFLAFDLANRQAYQGPASLHYLAGGLGWSAHYVGVLQQGKLKLSAYAKLNNRSGLAFDDAKVQLLLGKLNQVSHPSPRPMRRKAMMAMAEMDVSPGQSAPTPQAIGDYHLYSLPGKLSLADKSVMQVKLLPEKQRGMKRFYQTNHNQQFFYANAGAHTMSRDSLPVKSKLRFEYETQAKHPLPNGTVKLYQADAAGDLKWLGEDHIAYTPKGEPVTLTLGEQPGIKVSYKADKLLRKPVHGPYKNMYHGEFSVYIRNTLDKPVDYVWQQSFDGIVTNLSSDANHKRLNNSQVEWRITLDAGEKVRLKFGVDVGL